MYKLFALYDSRKVILSDPLPHSPALRTMAKRRKKAAAAAPAPKKAMKAMKAMKAKKA